MPTTTVSTTLLESVNIVLANLGEAPVDSITGSPLPLQVRLALNTIEEVSADIQSKGWWYNQSSSYHAGTGVATGTYAVTNDITIYPSEISDEWHGAIPEEARRYITIRAARIAQTRLIGSEELQKFTYNEELVSLAILQQAHVRNSDGVLDFNDFPEELRGLGIDEVMFLQGNLEEKIGTLRLGGELANIAKTKAETSLLADQEALVTQQVLTEAQETIKRGAEAGLVTTQQSLVAQQVLDSIAEVALKTKQGLKIDEEVDLLEAQEELTDAQKATELQNAIKVAADAGLVTTQQSLVAQQVLDTVAETAIKEAQKLKIDEETLLVTEQKTLVTKQALTEVQNAIKVSADSGLVTAQQALVSQQVLDSAADVTLKGKQGSLIDAQASTEAQNAIKVAADAGLVTTQQALIAQQILDVAADIAVKGKQEDLLEKQALDVAADTTLKGKQGIKLDADTGLTTQQQALTAQQTLDVVADTELKGKQGSLLEKQADDVVADTSLKGKQGTKIDAETGLTTQQQALTAQQTLGVVATTEKTDAEKDLLDSQKTQLDAQTAIGATAEKAFYDGVVGDSQDTYRTYGSEMRIMGIQESDFQTLPAYKKVELLKDANSLRTLTTTSTVADSTTIAEVNKILRFIGEHPVSAVGDNSLASEAFRLLQDTDQELQGRGWWFNTEEDVELTPTSGGAITVAANILSVEVDDYDTRIEASDTYRRLYDLKEKSALSFTSSVKAKIIYQRDLIDTPVKYREYLNVRVAILLTELYPQSGIDIQRLPKMEQELRAYFKDREADNANYSVFDNYDVVSRLGINRNYQLI